MSSELYGLNLKSEAEVHTVTIHGGGKTAL